MNETENRDVIAVNDTVNKAHDKPSRLSSFFAFSEKLSSLVYLRWLMIAFLPFLILLKYPVDMGDYDLWWQMAHGKYYITHHTLSMDLSMFSWTPTDPIWIYNTCLGSIAIYLFYNFMGGFGLWLFQWLIFGGIFLSFYFFLRLLNQRLDVNSVTIIAAIAIACYPTCRDYKPELFSALLFCWTMFIFFYIKMNRTKYLFYLYPLIFAFWVNLHGAFLIGLVFLAMAFTGEILNRIFFSTKSLTTEELVHFGIACVLSGAATLLNPYGINYLQSLFPTMMNAIGSDSYSGPYDKIILAYENLWPYLKNTSVTFFIFGFTAWIMTLMIFSICSLFIYELIKKKSCDFTLLIVSLALYWKGMETSRTSSFFLLAFFFVFFYLLIYRLNFKGFSGKATIFSLLVFAFFFVSISWYTIRYNADREWFGAGLDNLTPVKEVAFLKKYKPEGQIFNDYLIGGYLLWDLYPDYKVFIDPRGGLYRNQVFPDYIEFTTKPATSEDIHRFTKKYPFRIAIIHYRQMPLIFYFLKAGDEWRLLYFEKNAAILIHKTLLPAVNSKISNQIKDPKVLFNVLNNPVRFKDVRNPVTLLHVFSLYIGQDPKAGRYIHDIFKNNVSDYFKMKTQFLQLMDIAIKRQEQEQG